MGGSKPITPVTLARRTLTTWATSKAWGHIYQQTFIDTYAKVAFVKLYDRKNALAAAEMLNDKVVPFFEQYDLRLLRILTDRGTEYCGIKERHEYQLYLAIEDIDHTKTKAKTPQTNGICERFHRTIQDEFHAIAFRKKVYRSTVELQVDLDRWMDYCNNERTHSGKYCFGKTPMQTFQQSILLAIAKLLEYLAEDQIFSNPPKKGLEESGLVHLENKTLYPQNKSDNT